MKQFHFDLLKTLELIYMSAKAGDIYPYPRTIFNILTGNPNSLNAQRYEDSPYYGLYKGLKFTALKETLTALEPDYVTAVSVYSKARYQLTPNAIDYIKQSSEHLDQRFFNNPHIDRLFNIQETLQVFTDDYFETTFKTEKAVTQITHNNVGEVFLASINQTVAYESNDEKLFLEYLDQNQAIRNLKTQALCIPFEKNNRQRKYYPDFVIHTQAGHIIVCEIKALSNMSYYLNMEKYQVLKEYCKLHGYGYGTIGFKGKFYSYEDLENRAVNPKLEQRVKKALAKNNKFNPNQYKFFKERHRVHPLDIHTLVIKNNYKKIKLFDTVDIRSHEG